jgi:hypothetical protein
MSRRRSRVRVSRDKVVGLLVALACLAFSAVGLKVNEPPAYDYVNGVRGAAVTIERAEITVGEVRVGTRLLSRGAVQAETEGIFVAVRVALAVPGRERVNINGSQLVTQQRTYANRSSTGLVANAGFSETKDLVFEVDPAQIDDLTLQLWSSGVVSGFSQRARIHLGITADNAAQWREAATGTSIEPDVNGTVAALP